MNEPTEREKKLLEYILFLIGTINTFEYFYSNLNRSAVWLDDRFVQMDMRKNQDGLLNFLKNEFDISLKKELVLKAKENNGRKNEQ